MDKELERKFGPLLFCMIIVARILYAQKWKDARMEEWMIKAMELSILGWGVV